MIKLNKNTNGFTVVEGLLIVLVVAVIGFGGYYVWHTQHKTSTANTTSTAAVKTITSTPSKSTTSTTTPTQQYLTISAWGVRVPYQGGDTLSVSGQTCYENGDAAGDTVNLGCQVTINSQDLTNSVGSCTAKVSGTEDISIKWALMITTGIQTVADTRQLHNGLHKTQVNIRK